MHLVTIPGRIAVTMFVDANKVVKLGWSLGLVEGGQ